MHIRIMLLLLALVPVFGAGAETMRELEVTGTHLQLAGDFDGAMLVQERLVNEFEEPAGHIFALNTIVTQLSWDETQTRFDAPLLSHADSILSWCNPKLDDPDLAGTAYFYCGQAHFTLAYFHGLRGNYYQAGRQGTLSIEHLENALATNPRLEDAKMYLGVAYYIADNLPPFIKMFSRLLWFIPTGNSEKSLPYLKAVMEKGDLYPDVARYIYSSLLLDSNEEQRAEARTQLEELITRYPSNARFQLRLISMLLMDDQYEDTLSAADRFLSLDPAPPEPEASLARIWMVRAHLGVGQVDNARRLFDEVEPMFTNYRDDLPGWSLTWHLLTAGQLHDLANHREKARETYRNILNLAGSTYVSDFIQAAARAGLATPYRTINAD